MRMPFYSKHCSHIHAPDHPTECSTWTTEVTKRNDDDDADIIIIKQNKDIASIWTYIVLGLTVRADWWRTSQQKTQCAPAATTIRHCVLEKPHHEQCTRKLTGDMYFLSCRNTHQSVILFASNNRIRLTAIGSFILLLNIHVLLSTDRSTSTVTPMASLNPCVNSVCTEKNF